MPTGPMRSSSVGLVGTMEAAIAGDLMAGEATIGEATTGLGA